MSAFSLFSHLHDLRAQTRIRAVFDCSRHVRVDREKNVARNYVAQHDDPVAFDFCEKSLFVCAPIMVRHLGQVLRKHSHPLCSSPSKLSTKAANCCTYNRFEGFALGVRA